MDERGQGKAARVTFTQEEKTGRERQRERGKQCVVDRQMSGCRAVSGELDTCQSRSQFPPAIGATPGLVLIGQDASPNPSLVLFNVCCPLSSIQRCGEWTKAEDEKGASL